MAATGPAETTASEDQPPRHPRLAPLVRWLLLAAGLALLLSLCCQPRAPLYGYELKTVDSRFRFRSEAPRPGRVVIVAIDDRSVGDRRLGRWPWDRKWHAALIRRLTAEGARAIAFDVMFSEPSSISSDRDLASAIAASRRVFLALHPAQLRGSPQVVETARRFAVEPQIVHYQQLMLALGGVVPPLNEFAQAATGGGVVAAVPDADGVMRRAPLLLSVADRKGASQHLYPTLPLALAAFGGGWNLSGARFNLTREAALAPGHKAPLDGAGNLLINFLDPTQPLTTVSYADVLDGRFEQNAFRDRIVLVGFTAEGLLDHVPTPLAASVPGVEVLGQTLETLTQGRHLKTGTFGNTLGLALLLGAVATVAAASTRPVLGLAIVLLALGAYNAASLRAFSAGGAIWPGLAPNLTALLSFASIAVFRLATEEEGRRRLRNEFGRYAPPQVVARLDAGEMKIRAAGVKRQVTSLFADVRGFTAWSAGADPTDVVAVLNTYYEAMTQLAFDVEGTVDNIVGDEIFVTFNAIEDQEDHVERAVDLAINMIAALDGLNERWQAAGTLPRPLRIGVGVNTGEALVGSLGSHVRTQYTVLGQSVNLAARLQALNKDLGTTILASKEVADAVGLRVQLRNHGLKEVRGHPVPVEVYEILGRLGSPSG